MDDPIEPAPQVPENDEDENLPTIEQEYLRKKGAQNAEKDMLLIEVTSWHGGYRNIQYLRQEQPPADTFHFDNLKPEVQARIQEHFDKMDKDRDIRRNPKFYAFTAEGKMVVDSGHKYAIKFFQLS